MNEKLKKAFKLVMGENMYNKWLEACDKLDSGEINFEQYDQMMSGNYTLVLDLNRSQIIYVNRDRNETSVAYLDY